MRSHDGSGAIVTVDSRYDLPRFTGVTAATPNEAELGELTGAPVDDERAVEKAGRQLLERLDARLLLVTRGSQGMALLERDGGATFIPIFGTDEIADVTGRRRHRHRRRSRSPSRPAPAPWTPRPWPTWRAASSS